MYLVCIYLWLYSPFLHLAFLFFAFFYTQSVGLLGWGISPSQGRYLHNTNTEQMHTDIHTLSCIRTHDPVFERAKTVHALDRAAIVIGTFGMYEHVIYPNRSVGM
jgi:hypothetical protein